MHAETRARCASAMTLIGLGGGILAFVAVVTLAITARGAYIGGIAYPYISDMAASTDATYTIFSVSMSTAALSMMVRRFVVGAHSQTSPYAMTRCRSALERFLRRSRPVPVGLCGASDLLR